MKTNQPELPGLADARPRELVVSGPELDETIVHLRLQGARVWALETVRGCNGQWRLRLHWNETTTATQAHTNTSTGGYG